MTSRSPPPTPKFHSARLVYRAFEDSDIDFLIDMKSDPLTQMGGFGSYPHPIRKVQVEKVASYAKKALLCVVACLPKSPAEPTVAGKSIGWLILSAPRPGQEHHRRIGFGISYHKDYQSRGYGGESLEWLFDAGFTKYGVHKIEGLVFGWNAGARALYKKMGFTEEVVSRKSCFAQGEFWDEVHLGLLEDEWRQWKADKAVRDAQQSASPQQQ